MICTIMNDGFRSVVTTRFGPKAPPSIHPRTSLHVLPDLHRTPHANRLMTFVTNFPQTPVCRALQADCTLAVGARFRRGIACA